jgi:hypothetical protein
MGGLPYFLSLIQSPVSGSGLPSAHPKTNSQSTRLDKTNTIKMASRRRSLYSGMDVFLSKGGDHRQSRGSIRCMNCSNAWFDLINGHTYSKSTEMSPSFQSMPTHATRFPHNFLRSFPLFVSAYRCLAYRKK